MLLLAGILLAVFVVAWPWGIVTVVAGGLLDVGESFAFPRASAPTADSRRHDFMRLRVGEAVVVRELDGLTLVAE